MMDYIDETRRCALCVAINRTSFLKMASCLMEVKQVLDCLLREKGSFDLHRLDERVLQGLSDSLRDLLATTRSCSSRSRIFLLYRSEYVVGAMRERLDEVCRCLGMVMTTMMAQADVELPAMAAGCIRSFRDRKTGSDVASEAGFADLAGEISQHIGASDARRSTELLRKIADRLNVSEFEAAELKQELERDARKAESEPESEGIECIETLRDLRRFFSSAQVLMDERRRLASIGSPECGITTSIPSSFFCPMTKALMREPVTIEEEGYTYEKSAITEWFDAGHKTCPDTGKELVSLALTPNLKLRRAMDQFFDNMHQAQMVYVLQELRNERVTSAGMPAERAVETVKRLMDMDPKYRELVVSLDGIEPLVHLLKLPSDPHVQETVTQILIDISAIGSEQKVQMHITCMSSGLHSFVARAFDDAGAQRCVILSFYGWMELISFGMAMKVTIVEAGAVGLASALVRDNDSAERCLLIRLLSDLSTTDAGKKAMSSERGFMRLIADAFHSTPPEERQHVKALLDNVCEGDPNMIMEAARCSMFQPLVSCLTQG
jgi:hypothetical protein